jgi:hypothetical protein
MTHQFTFGMSASSYTNVDGETVNTVTGDGQNIFSASHTITGASTTFSNLITNEFSRDGIESAEDTFNTFQTNNQNIVLVSPDTIITTRSVSLVNTVREFLNSVGSPDTANNSVNIYQKKYNYIVLPFLATTALGVQDSTKDKYWMLADLKHTDAICDISEMPSFTAPQEGGNGEVFETEDWMFKSSASYDLGVLDFKWIVGSTGATS